MSIHCISLLEVGNFLTKNNRFSNVIITNKHLSFGASLQKETKKIEYSL